MLLIQLEPTVKLEEVANFFIIIWYNFLCIFVYLLRHCIHFKKVFPEIKIADFLAVMLPLYWL